MTRYGAFNPPASMTGGIQHVFARSDDLGWLPNALAVLRGHGRTPLVTIEPWSGMGDTLAFVRQQRQELWLRYGHEFNGNWYPWAGDPIALKRAWATIADAAPFNVKLIWPPNIHYLGAADLHAYWPGDGVFDGIGLDGYDQINGAPPVSFNELFLPTLNLIRTTIRPANGTQWWVCETATPRRHAERPSGANQAGWIQHMKQDAPGMGLDAVLWLNADKSDGKWALGSAGEKALFGKAGK